MLPFEFSVRKCAIGFAAVLCVSSAVGPAAAQTLFSNDIAWPGLTRDDIDRMHAAAARLYEGRSIGTVERWRSPDSKDAGEVKLLSIFESNGMPCRRLDYRIRFDEARNRPSHYLITWCKIPEGDWKIVELAPPR